MSACLEAAARPEATKGGRLFATRSKRKNADIKAEVEQMHAEMNDRNGCVTELAACIQDSEQQLVQTVARVQLTESKYSLLNNENRTLKQRLATIVL